MTKMLTSTALIAMLAGPALAQTTAPATTDPATTAPATTAPATTMPATTAPADTAVVAPAGTAGGFGYTAAPTDLSADTFTDKDLYVAEGEIDTAAIYNEADADWESIGEIDDLVISETGQIQAVIVDIGGFLGLGEKSVSVSMDQLRIIRDGDSEGDYFIVFTANREALENAPEFEWADRM